MPSIFVHDGSGRPRRVPLIKRITSIGEAQANDISVAGAGMADTHANLHFDGERFSLNVLEGAATVKVNGKRVKSCVLRHGDVIEAGAAKMDFLLYDEPRLGQEELDAARLEAFRKMVEFNRRLMSQASPAELIDELLDSVIELTRADKGMLILLEDGRLQVKAARNLKKETIGDAVEKLSDTILAEVIRSRRPLIVSDALHHERFSGSESVVNLKLCSVMAAPLLEKGELFGVLYLGNDNVVNLFEERSLEVLDVFSAQASLLIRNALLMNDLILDNRQLSRRLEQMRFGELIGACQPMQEVFRKIEKVAPTDISVLVTGETGTGKELVARRIHELSPRASRPFVTINCGAIPPNLLESELFGHVRGAFTGATATRPGRFQAADRGTLFLDEIGELPPELQVKLLRALQEKTVTKVGDNRPEAVDIRVISATNRDLEKALEQKQFREDLFYRINVVALHLPPLRERGEDVVLIGRYLLGQIGEEMGARPRNFSPSAVEAMRKYGWPGNIRELENRIRKALVLCDKTHLSAADLDLSSDDLEQVMPLAQAKDEFQKKYVKMVLEKNGGNRTKTAHDLGVDPRTIFRFLEKMNGAD